MSWCYLSILSCLCTLKGSCHFFLSNLSSTTSLKLPSNTWSNLLFYFKQLFEVCFTVIISCELDLQSIDLMTNLKMTTGIPITNFRYCEKFELNLQHILVFFNLLLVTSDKLSSYVLCWRSFVFLNLSYSEVNVIVTVNLC